ncbi:hypothetical protein P3S68_031081 [Capsicum galapagoense]
MYTLHGIVLATIKKHLPVSGQEGEEELTKIAVMFEELIYTAATNQKRCIRDGKWNGVVAGQTRISLRRF